MNQKLISLSDLNQILMQLGQNLGLSSFALDNNHVASLMFDDQFLVELQALDCEGNKVRTLYLIAALCPEPQSDNPAELITSYQKFLQSNLSGKIMSGLSFALDKESNEILLIRPLPTTQLDLSLIESEMENFVNVLEQWARCLQHGEINWNNPAVKAQNSKKSSVPMKADTQAKGAEKSAAGMRV